MTFSGKLNERRQIFHSQQKNRAKTVGMEGEDVIAVFESIKNIYRFDFDLKKEQINIIQLILNVRHMFGLLPTGFGKSVCYMLPPLMLE